MATLNSHLTASKLCAISSKVSTIKTELCKGLSSKNPVNFSTITPQSIAGCALLKKLFLAEKLLDLVNMLEPLAEYNIKLQHPKNLNISDIEQAVNICITKELNDFNNANDFNIAAVRDDIKKLDVLMHEIKNSTNVLARTENVIFSPCPTEDKPEAVSVTEHSESYIINCVNDFINQSEIDFITSVLSDCTFSEEHGHSVCAFGADYRYNGSRATTRDFPEPIKELVDKINSKFYNSGDKINSCLVNKYSGNDAFLPEHSDNESSIDPESSIFTISIGAKANIVFRDISDVTESKHLCESGSLYYMSRHSQDFFSHRINKSDMGEEVRYSLTFRVVGWCFKNSTCVIGDSNTGKLKFGTEVGTFGYTMPGKREWAATINDIDPTCCSSYKNVIILCGINDIKSKHIRNSNDIKELYIRLKCKIEQIHLLNKRANIFVCPILPTKLSELNRKALDFNKFILGDLCQSCPGVSLVLGFDEFLDQDGYLAKDVSFAGDHLHLNLAGARHLATLFKASISLKNGGSGRIRKKLYSAAVSEGTGGGPA